MTQPIETSTFILSADAQHEIDVFTQCSGFDAGGYSLPNPKGPFAPVSPPSVTLTRGFTGSTSLWAWQNAVSTGNMSLALRNCTLRINDAGGNDIAIFELVNARLSKLEMTLRRGAELGMYETVTITCDKFQLSQVFCHLPQAADIVRSADDGPTRNCPSPGRDRPDPRAAFLGWVVVRTMQIGTSPERWSLIGIVAAGVLDMLAVRIVVQPEFFQTLASGPASEQANQETRKCGAGAACRLNRQQPLRLTLWAHLRVPWVWS